jgi:arylsulfatase A-like enzyme
MILPPGKNRHVFQSIDKAFPRSIAVSSILNRLRILPQADGASSALLLCLNAGLLLWIAESLYFFLDAGFMLTPVVYTFAVTAGCALGTGLLLTGVITGADRLSKFRFFNAPLPLISAVLCSAPQMFVTSYLLKSFGLTTLISLAVLLIGIAALFMIFSRFHLHTGRLVLFSIVSSLQCIVALNSDFALSRVSSEKMNLYFLYVHAMPLLSLVLTGSLYVVCQHCHQKKIPLIVTVLSLVGGLSFLFIALPGLPINSLVLKNYLMIAAVSMVLLGATRIQVITHIRYALLIWVPSLPVFLILLIVGVSDIGVVWSISQSTVLSTKVFKEFGLFKKSFENTLRQLRAQPQFETGKKTLRAAAEWNRKNAGKAKTGHSVLLITIDALRYDTLGRYHPDEKSYTPNLDRLVKRATYFKHTYAQGGWTSISLPALIWARFPRHILFTPIYEDNKFALHLSNKAPKGRQIKFRFQSPLNEANETIADVLNTHGYATYAVTNDGSTSYFTPELGFSSGFKKILYPKDIYNKYTNSNDIKMDLDEVTTQTVLETIKDQGDKPFFIWTHLFAPHAPYNPPKGYGIPFENYEGEVYFADKMVGRLLRALKRQERDKDTIVIVTSDHGEAFGEHRQKYHGKELFDPSTRVFLLVQLPGRTKGNEVETPVGLIDIAPTILGFLGIPIPDSMQGLTLHHIIQGRKKHFERPPVFMETWQDALTGERTLNLIGAVKGRHKLIMDVVNESISMYDLKSDPDEKKNLLGRQTDTSKDVLLKLGGYLYGWQQITSGVGDAAK